MPSGYENSVAAFLRSTVRSYDVDETIVLKNDREVDRMLDLFNEEAKCFDNKNLKYGEEEFERYAYNYDNYNLFVYYWKYRVMFFIVDGTVTGYAVVDGSVWDQNVGE